MSGSWSAQPRLRATAVVKGGVWLVILSVCMAMGYLTLFELVGTLGGLPFVPPWRHSSLPRMVVGAAAMNTIAVAFFSLGWMVRGTEPASPSTCEGSSRAS